MIKRLLFAFILIMCTCGFFIGVGDLTLIKIEGHVFCKMGAWIDNTWVTTTWTRGGIPVPDKYGCLHVITNHGSKQIVLEPPYYILVKEFNSQEEADADLTGDKWKVKR